jgi:glycogen operon protein
LRADGSLALGLMLDSLHYWVSEMHVDGFRYDLAVSLGRHAQGAGGVHGFDSHAAFFGLLARDPVLRRVKHIAEPGDLGPHGYQLGRFPVPFSEWNGCFRDDVRDYFRSASSGLGAIARRLEGSPDLYDPLLRGPSAGVSFVTSHDGFSLRDLVSYEHKHNQQNGEHNRDGEDHNRSWNCGVEGPTDHGEVLALRARQQRNLLAAVLLARGVPMLRAGDEISHTQHGNNNAYCQDNELSWLDWEHADAALLAWTRALIALRKEHAALRPVLRLQPIEWYRPDGGLMTEADFAAPYARALGALLGVSDPRASKLREDTPRAPRLFVILNAGATGLRFGLPRAVGELRHVLDSSEPQRAAGQGALSGHVYVRERSLRVLEEATPR